MTTARRLPRGIRNNNPGNIVRTKQQWKGMADDQSADPRFIVFENEVYGLRALMRLLINYQTRHKLDTVEKIINRWAPPVGRDQNGKAYTQNTSAYVNEVAELMRVDRDQPIDIRRDRVLLIMMARAIVRHENGPARAHNVPHEFWYDAKAYEDAADLALDNDKPRESLKESRTIKAGTAAATATVAGIVADAADKASVLSVVSQDYVKYAFAAFALVAIGAMIYARIDDHLNKKR